MTTLKVLPKFNNLVQLMQYFSDEKICLEHLKQMRWKDGAYCPHCGCKKVYAFSETGRKSRRTQKKKNLVFFRLLMCSASYRLSQF